MIINYVPWKRPALINDCAPQHPVVGGGRGWSLATIEITVQGPLNFLRKIMRTGPVASADCCGRLSVLCDYSSAERLVQRLFLALSFHFQAVPQAGKQTLVDNKLLLWGGMILPPWMVFKVPKGESWRDVFPRRRKPSALGRRGYHIRAETCVGCAPLSKCGKRRLRYLRPRSSGAICQLPSMVYLWRGKTDMTRCGNVG